MNARRVAVRWTIGDVGRFGYETLRLSVWGARRLFGPDAAYVICLNSVELPTAQQETGGLPREVRWHDATHDMPALIQRHLDENKAEGVGWKFAPLRLFPDRYELALDNDCILWEMPAAIRTWLDTGTPPKCVIAEDVSRMPGQFAADCGPHARNSGIRGLPAGFRLDEALGRLLRRRPVILRSELDEQGLQVAAVSLDGEPLVVELEEVTICSPFPPHLPYLGRCGAHFVGLNAKQLPWKLHDRPAVDHLREHWLRHRGEVYRRVGISPGHLKEAV